MFFRKQHRIEKPKTDSKGAIVYPFLKKFLVFACVRWGNRERERDKTIGIIHVNFIYNIVIKSTFRKIVP